MQCEGTRGQGLQIMSYEENIIEELQGFIRNIEQEKELNYSNYVNIAQSNRKSIYEKVRFYGLKLLTLLVSKGYGRDEVIAELKGGLTADHTDTRNATLVFLKALIENSEDHKYLIEVLIELQHVTESKVRKTVLEGWMLLVGIAKGYDEALQAAIASLDDPYEWTRMASVELLIELVKRDQINNPLLGRVERISNDEGWGVKIRAAKLCGELLAKGYSYESGLKNIVRLSNDECFEVRRAALNTLTDLVRRDCAVEVALREVKRFVTDKFYDVRDMAIENLCVALVDKGYGLQEAEEALSLYMKSEERYDDKAAIKLCISLVEHGKCIKLGKEFTSRWLQGKAWELQSVLKQKLEDRELL